jgi:hypothetical protein
MPWSPARRKYFARTHVEHDVPALPRAMEPFEAGAFVHLFRTDGHPVSPAREARLHAAIAVIVAWLPLVFLSPPPPEASTTERVAALLLDGTTSRYLVAIPLLIIGQRVLTRQLGSIVRAFAHGDYLTGVEKDRFARRLASSGRLLPHRAATFGIVLTSVLLSLLGAQVRGQVPPESLGQLWRVLVSQPLFLCCALAWVWRTIHWARLVWHISSSHLRLSPAHPDLAAGLLFVSRSVPAYIPFAVAFGTVVAARFGEALLVHHGAPSDHVGPMLVMLASLLAMAVGPVIPLMGPIRRAQLRGIMEYGTLATQLGHRFEDRWLRRETLRPEALSAQDFSATTDLYSIVTNVTRIRFLPVDIRAVIALLLAALLPFLPVMLLTMSPSKFLHLVTTVL